MPIARTVAARELQRRRRARRGYHAYVGYQRPAHHIHWHHLLLDSYLDRFAVGDITRLIVCMPPRHGKSERGSRLLPPYILGRNPDTKIIACSHTADLASSMNRDVQRVMETQRYRRLFPGAILPADNARTVSGRPLRNSQTFELVGREGSYKCAGVGGSIVGKGFDVGIIDDPTKGHEAADSPTQRAKLWHWYTRDFYTRCAPGARILVISTRWNEEDLVGMLLKAQADDPKADKWSVLVLRAIREHEDNPEDPRQPGEALWPAFYPIEALEKVRANSERDFSSQYQQRPRAAGGVEWPDHYFAGPGFWFDDWPILQELEIRTIALDPSKGTDAKRGDYQALVKFARDRKGVEYAELDLAHRPMVGSRGPDDSILEVGMVEQTADWCYHFQPHGFGLESNQFQVLLKIPLLQEFRRRRIETPIYELNHHDPKTLRIRRLSAPLGQHKIRFRNTPGTRKAVEQLRQFPLGEFDDGPDALEMARRLAVMLYNGDHGYLRTHS